MPPFYIRRVLVADADATIHKLTDLGLREVGRFTVFPVKAAAELVKEATRNRVDVVLLGEGLELATGAILEQLKAALPAVPVVLMITTEEPMASLRERCRAMGAAAVLKKPLSPIDLADDLRKAVGAEAGAPPDVLFRGK
jgi:CheY-like chemotaxis protein